MTSRKTDVQPAATHRLIARRGVIVVELHGPLREEDFEAIAATADKWIADHGYLAGIVVHARAFPGWQDFEGFRHHVRFLQDHHRDVRRVAVASESAVAKIAPRIAAPFVRAQLKTFAYDELDEAIAWASTPPDDAPR
jgi:hypothetical protein